MLKVQNQSKMVSWKLNDVMCKHDWNLFISFLQVVVGGRGTLPNPTYINIFLTGRKKKVGLFIVNHLPGFCTSSLWVLCIPWNIYQLSIHKGRQYVFLSPFTK